MLHLHRAERADCLVEALADLVDKPLDDPMVAEVVSVPTRGVERWLAQRLAARLGAGPGGDDGVCANFDFPFPGRLIGGAVAEAAGLECDGVRGVGRDADPWLPERSVWPLLAVVDECLSEAWLAPLARHLEADRSRAGLDWRSRRFAAVRRMADLFDRYAVHRPDMLREWAEGEGPALPSDLAWQAELWRRLRRRIAVPSSGERLASACDRLRNGDVALDLPPRLSLFGLTRLPASYVQVLDALAVQRDVHLFLLHPSPSLWGRVAGMLAEAPAPRRRRDDRTLALAANPLLASWGQDAREMQLVLTQCGASTAATVDEHHPLPAGRSQPASLLARIQADVRADRPPPGTPVPGQADRRPLLGSDDRSVEIHACHGQARQVEVLRDAILHLLAADPTLEVRDVIVMCPDIETFAPLIHATFGAGDEEDLAPSASASPASASPAPTSPPDLRVRLADRSLRQTNPVLGVVAELLDLATQRLTASQVLDLAGREPVRRRFEFDDDDLARLDAWVSATGVRWGLDGRHRASFKLEWLEANTWRTGLDRVLLGVAMAEDGQRLVGGVLPLDDVGSSDIDLAGRFAEFVDRLQAAVDSFAGAEPLEAWTARLADAADALVAVADTDSWQRVQLEGLLDDVLKEATAAGALAGGALTLPEVRTLLADRLRGRPTRANFRTGHLTVCTLVPMRSVPHRVVCLLGLDDGVFPRHGAHDGDDIIGYEPHVGDRDARVEDRQLLLDALLAATKHLVITYAGRDERTNAARPPAVPVGELLDVIDGTVRVESGRARDRVVIHHPLQSFDARNFLPTALLPARRWSFDPVALEGAQALTEQRVDRAPFLPTVLPPLAATIVELDALVRFAQHPVDAFLRQRLRITLADKSDDPADAVPIELDALELWGVGQRLLDARLTGRSPAACEAAELARGLLPPGELGRPVLDRLRPVVDGLFQAAAAIPGAGDEVGSLEVDIALHDGRRLVGTVAGVCGTQLRTVSYSRVGPKHRLAAWVRLLALTAAHAKAPFEAVTIGRRRSDGRRGAEVTVARLGSPAGDSEARQQWALGHLGSLVAMYDAGMRAPLPLYCQTSATYAAARRRGLTAEGAARKALAEWESTWDFDREDKEQGHQLVLGGIRSFGEVLAQPRPAGAPGWPADEPTRFGGCARLLWDGLLSVETIEDR